MSNYLRATNKAKTVINLSMSSLEEIIFLITFFMISPPLILLDEKF